ncbi:MULTISPECIES: hypothetical protein [Fusobacterium]|jgi:outer membrane murein-binding lipoprotein Lpp|uniref:hypothetical protein n=1 Tax=Fusobacterium TaxID=848 RepID=UPI000E46AD2F|nr:MULTISPECIES: hypothetical protein [Fusobacterium]MCB8564140.1 hypothetical protein [Fusobacterium ulcerans]MCB8648469.1 hypothetical protein [Fusobacterium ulcerans]MDH6457721.1 outer membrane murein-binding lipoprotein Lpp [Fusobacterium sp. PH5-7]MEE0138766.1 hypothetical protein [Fusobacterium ulcerans]RGY67098.1 hypothetical protein DXA30_00605 [Fusobacterium ulcerans]
MKMKKLNYIIAGSLLSALVLAGCGNDKPNQEVQKLMTETQKDFAAFQESIVKDSTMTEAQAEDKIQKLLSEIQVKEDAAKKEVANIKNKAEQDKLTKEIEKTFGTMKEALTSLEMKIKTPTPNPYEEQVEVQEIESVEGTNDGQAQSN